MKRAWIVLAACAVLAGGVCADQLRLKDGSVINGTIVGFDENSFKVKTNYGYAMVRRDQVVSIEVSDPDADAAGKKPAGSSAPAPAGSGFPSANGSASTPPVSRPAATAKPPQPTAAHPASSAPATNPNASPANAPANANGGGAQPAAASEASVPPAKPPAIVPTKTMMAPPTKRASGSAAGAANPPAITATKAPGAAIVPASAPPPIPKPAPPEPIREGIEGNTYTNDTYGFRMYRPPGWDIIADARTTLPGAIAALGTSDQTTYLLVGASASAGTLDLDLRASDVKLKEMVENYRPLGDKKSTVAGLPAIERRFRGAVDGKDWSGTVVLLQRGKQLYTIFGMTYAGTDLVQIQENVIHRSITSLQFTK